MTKKEESSRGLRAISIHSNTTGDDMDFLGNIQTWLKPKECYSHSSRESWNEEVFQNVLGNIDVPSTS